MSRRVLAVIAILIVVVLGGTAFYWFSIPNQPVISVTGAWVRSMEVMMATGDAQPAGQGTMQMGMPTPTGEMNMELGGGGSSAAYMVIHNQGRVGDKLVRVETTIAGMPQLHKTQTQNGMTMMFEVPGLDIPAMGTLELKPKSTHVMLMQVKQSLKVGDKVTLVLYFEKSAPLTIEADVRAQ